MKSLLNIEEALGTNWLNKLGVIILVIGVALFLAYQLRELGRGGKVFVGYVVSLGMLGAGVFFERRERWRILARAAIGGGWALLFFVTYAMRNVPAAEVIHSNALDLVLLLIVGAAMVGHTLRYRSQVVTGLAFLLAFSTLNISRVSDVHSLFADGILAIALVFIVGRLRWFELEIFGILATYCTHYYWLHPIIEPMGTHHHEFPEYLGSSLLLTLYWLAFRSSYVVRWTPDERQENVSTVAALLNTGLYIWVMGYQSVHPEKAFQFFLAVGAVELVLGQLPITRRRRTAFVILTTIGAVLLVAAFPYKYSGSDLSLWWVAEAETFFLVGVFTREVLFRRLGMLAGLLTAGQIAILDTAQVNHLRSAASADVPQPHLAWVYAVAALTLYFNAHGAPRLWPNLAEKRLDGAGFRAASHVAGLLAFLGVWVACNEYWMGLAWCALALVLVFLGARWKILELSLQGHCVTAIALLRLYFVNLQTIEVSHYVSLRLAIVSMAAVLMYVASRWAGQGVIDKATRIGQGYTWAASTLVALLIWYQLRPVSVALGWTIFGLLLFELGFARRSTNLRVQAYLAFGASFVRIFFVNLNASGYPGELSPRIYTTVPLALVFYYVYWRFQERSEDFLQTDRRIKAANLHNYLGAVTLAALMRFELPADWVAAAWATLILALLAAALKIGQRIFLDQGILVAFAVLFRAVLHNFYQRSYFPAPFWQSRMVCVGAAIAALFLALPFAFRLSGKAAADSGKKRNWLAQSAATMGRHPDQFFFFIPFFLLTVLLALEMPSGLVTVAWGIEAVAVFLFALWVEERSYRLSGLVLLLLCVGKIVFRDVWGLHPRDRYLTFIVLGAALLGVSYLYTRYREVIRQYL